MKIKQLVGIGSILITCLFSNAYTQTNNPYKIENKNQSTLYSVFSQRPKHLDPARSYSSNEAIFTGQIYEPVLQYHYLKRPYQLVPLTATKMPEITYKDANGKIIKGIKLDTIATTSYLITLRGDIIYQLHPAFAKDENGEYRYHRLTPQDLDEIYTLEQFKYKGHRAVSAKDYQYQIMRLADPINHSPIAGIMSKRIVGFKKLQQQLIQWRKSNPNQPLPAELFQIDGVEVINQNQYIISIYGKDPQFIYWLAMPFFAPMPYEAEAFYRQKGMKDRNITLDWYPVGSGPYYLSENNPNRRMVLEKNPYYHADFYPSEGQVDDDENGFLARKGERLPQIDRIIFSLEKESIPMWNKFLQGYYDRSGISSDVFDQAVYFDQGGNVNATEDIASKGIRISTTVEPSIFYWGFNMLDPVVGGYSEKQRRLRQAISIVFNVEEFISIFMNGRALAAQGPVPPGIFGNQNDLNPVVYELDTKQRKSLAKAKRLLKAAGYPNGVDPKTGAPLILYLDAIGSGSPDEKAKFQWMRQQFKKLGIQLNIRITQYNRFQEKVRNAQVQLFFWGWNADYPDPENFLMLLYGPNGKAKFQGENAVNYQNQRFDELYEEMIQMDNTTERLVLIQKMVDLLREDAPWIWGVNPKSFILSHVWYYPTKPHSIANNMLKYAKIDTTLRSSLQKKWNVPLFWPVLIIFLILFLFALPVVVSYWRKEHKKMQVLNLTKVKQHGSTK
ncbi:ABC transporter substrate-binding protein [Thiotrichales bacterium 19S3-7]|nr:ABC transporter substrate-binding protein [Thiotrichales bacterium 19S3-7]MCF6801433.1 ABC transporter substrate-binding protein [Thiotrichales bacterium 19S3-11]